ncbi:MAG: nitroreductase family protein, partial [Halanaerobiales bacterium]|nr:nitroreductase family protein [Halanaerobiales bacterium]
MSGIVFFKTTDLEKITNFYHNVLKMDLWLDQNKCKIFQDGNLQVGFCQAKQTDKNGIITFYYENKKEVDKVYNEYKESLKIIDEPKENKKINIYQFFAVDPEGRTLEFQAFLHKEKPSLTGKELLLKRRSHRQYSDQEVSREVLDQIFEICRFSPTSMNSQSYYFKIIKDRELLCDLASIRKTASNPIKKAPISVAICSDNEQSNRYKQDGVIAAYHFMLAARLYNLGTCWIADMNRESIKKKLNIPSNHYIAT